MTPEQDHRWLEDLAQELHATNVRQQKALMMEIIETGYAELTQQYAGSATHLRELEAAYAWLRQRVDDFQG